MPYTSHQQRARQRALLQRKIIMAVCVLITLLLLTLTILLCANVVNAIRDRQNDPHLSPEDPIPDDPDDPKNPNDPDNPDNPDNPDTPDDPQKPEDPNNPDTPGDPDAPKDVINTVECTAADVGKGYLQVVNATTPYLFGESESRLVNIYNAQEAAKTRGNYFQLALSKLKMEKTAYTAMDKMLKTFYEISGKSDILVNSAYRSYEDQRSSGSSVPAGYSDSHIGLSCELRVLSSSGNKLYLNSSEDYAWITDHCYEYGFIVRYPLEKEEVTGVGEYDYYFRYVGYVHAYFMKQNNMCLEEYINYLHGYTVDSITGGGKTLHVDADNGLSYEIYYVAANGLKTQVPVPSETTGTYTISGDNISGYIVTVTLSDAKG